MSKRIRIIPALVFLTGITLLFAGIGNDWWGWMAKIQLLPAIFRVIGGATLGNIAVICAILLLTVLFGRFYCSVICPLGVMQDIIIWLRRQFDKKVRRPRVKQYRYNRPRNAVRWAVVAACIVSAVTAGQLFISLIAPYSAYGRIIRSLAGLSKDGSVAPALALTAVATFFLLATCAWLWGRAWCNTVCPVGTVLGLVASKPVFGICIEERKCVQCGRCVRSCKSSCIDLHSHKVDYSRCVDCLDCIARCKEGAVSFRRLDTHRSTAAAPDNGRRAFISTGVLMAAGLAAKAQEKLDGGLTPVMEKKDPMRTGILLPPGAACEDDFFSRCTACQLCVSSCPNHVLRPSQDLEHFLQPRMGYEAGYCRPECTVCSQVCPTGAIRPISREAKTLVKIGTAKVNAELCLSATGKESCGNCARHCPTGALRMVEDKERKTAFPTVNESLCIGCGACEYLCPSRPISAITVDGLSRHRQNKLWTDVNS